MPLRRLESLFDEPVGRKYKEGHVLLHQGDELTHIYYLQEGYVKLYAITDEGEERILLIFPPHTSFPLMPNMTRAKPHILRYFYEAMSDIKVCMVPRMRFGKRLEKDPEASQLMLDYITELSADLVRRLGIIENKDAKDKVTHLLPYLIKVCGHPSRKPGIYKLDLKITHQDMADMTGLARETISIQIKKMEDEGLISQRGDTMTINEALVPEEYKYASYNFGLSQSAV